MNSEENFLKDQVQRLNAELAKYRGHFPLPDSDEGSLPRDGPPAPWLMDKNVLSPLISEYDEQVKDLQDQISHYQDEVNKLRPEVDRLVAENNRLVKQLKESVETQLTGVDTEKVPQLNADEQVIYNLQQQAETALEEKDAALERWQESEHEVDRLHSELQAEKDSHQWKIVEKQAKQMQVEYNETVTLLNKEIEELQQDLRQTKQEFETASLQVRDIRRTNKEMEQQLQWKEQEISDTLFKEGVSDSKTGEFKKVIEDLRHRLATSTNEVDELKRDKCSLEVRVTEQQRRITELEEREFDAVQQVRDAIQMVENVVMEKEQSEIQGKQKDEELEQMQEVINKLINEAGARTRKEVDGVRSQCNERITKLTEELHTLEMDNAERQAQIDRLVREKRSVESELEKIYKDGMVEVSKHKGSYEEVNYRAVKAERARDDAELKNEMLQNRLKTETMQSDQLKIQMDTTIGQMKERMILLEQEFETLNGERLMLLEQVDEMKRQVQRSQQEKEAAERNYNKEMTILEQEQHMKMRDYEVKLQTTEDASRHGMGEVRKLLNAQQRMSARWKEECQTITFKFEKKITDMRSEMSQFKKRNEELLSLLKESQEKTLDAERMIAEYTRNIRRMEERMREADNRASETAKKLARQSVRERQLANERKTLAKELEKTMAASRYASLRHSSGPVADFGLSQRSLVNGDGGKAHLNIDDLTSDR